MRHFVAIIAAALVVALIGCSQVPGPAGLPAIAIPFIRSGSGNGQAPSGPPRGHILFVSNRDGAAEFYVMNADGSGLKRLTNGGGGQSWPSFSPDGRQILYERVVDNHPQIFIMNADGGQIANLSSDKSSDEFPSWSPDGRQIAFASDRDGHVGIYVMNRDGSSVRRLTDDPSNNWLPVWSPDGESIAFVSDRDGSDGNVFLMDASGNNFRQLTTGSSLSAKPSWAPDSQRLIAFTGGGLFTLTRDGNALKPITSDGEDPAWSPDGKWIAFASRRDAGHLQIYLITPDGSSIQRITKSNGEDWEPAWGP